MYVGLIGRSLPLPTKLLVKKMLLHVQQLRKIEVIRPAYRIQYAQVTPFDRRDPEC